MPELNPHQFVSYKVCMTCNEPIVKTPENRSQDVGEYFHARIGMGTTEDGYEEKMLLPVSTGWQSGHYILPKKEQNVYSPTGEDLPKDVEKTFKRY